MMSQPVISFLPSVFSPVLVIFEWAYDKMHAQPEAICRTNISCPFLKFRTPCATGWAKQKISRKILLGMKKKHFCIKSSLSIIIRHNSPYKCKAFLLILSTDEGIEGLGQFIGYSPKSQINYLNDTIKPLILGESCSDLLNLWSKMYWQCQGRNSWIQIIAAIDIDPFSFF